MNLFDRVCNNLKERRERLISGKINTIPWNLPRFEDYSPGIEKGKYYIITGQTKSGKSQLCDHMFVYNAFRQIKENNLPVKLRIKYFSLEMSEEEKMTQMISNLLFIKTGMKLIISPTNLRSTRKIVDSEIIKQIEEHREYIEEFLSCVEYITNIRNPFGIFNHMRDYALKNGIQYKKTVNYGNGDIEVDSHYIENDPEEYVICIVDHASL